MTSDEDILSGLGKLGRRGSGEAERSWPSAKGRARFVEAVTDVRHDRFASASKGQRWRTWSGALVVALSASLVVGSFVAYLALRSATTLQFVLEGAQATNGTFAQAPPEHVATVRFSDGSTVVLTPGASGRVNEIRERGARFSLEKGEASVHVTKRVGGADYLLQAGPYAVRVTGTEFVLRWNPTTQGMQLVLHEGSVLVTGPRIDDGVTLRAGQSFDVSPSMGMHIGEGELASAEASAMPPRTDGAPEIPAGVLPSSGVGGPEGTAGASSGAPASSVSSHSAQEERRTSWAERVAAGEFETVLTEADARGADSVVASGTLADVMALADAARYGGRARLATRCLKSVRSRFGGTKAASTAAFLLGRMAEDAGNLDGALGFYEATLSEGGTFAAEALGRKMLLVRRKSGDRAARPIAARYLKSYPRGPHAEVARQLANPIE